MAKNDEVRISPRTGKPMKKPRGGNSPVIGMNGYNLKEGDNTKILELNIELLNMQNIDLKNAARRLWNDGGTSKLTAKEWLMRGRGIDEEIQMLKRERETAFTAASRVCASYGGEKVQTSPGNVQEKKLLNYAAYNELIDARIDELYTVKGEIMNAVNKVDNAALRQLLTLRYVRFMKWEKIAKEMNYSRRQVQRLHGKALKEIGEFIPPRYTP